MPTPAKKTASKPTNKLATKSQTTLTTKKTVVKKSAAPTPPAPPAPPAPPTPVTPPTPPAPPVKPPAPVKKDRKPMVISTLFAIAALLLLFVSLWQLWQYNKLQNNFDNKIAAIQAEIEQAEIEASKELTQPPFTMRREPPQIVQVDEFTIKTTNGETLLIGLPIIAGHGQQGVYLGSQPPAADVQFAHDSKWTRNGQPVSKWHQVVVAQWDSGARRYIPISGMPLISRTLPDGSVRYQTKVWALVLPSS